MVRSVDDPVDPSVVVDDEGDVDDVDGDDELVEDPQTHVAMTKLGVDFAQGYQVSKPAPIVSKP